MGASQLIFLVLAIAPCILAESLIKNKCEVGDSYDIDCGKEVLQRFFRDSSTGVPEHNLKAIDPITIPNFKIVEDEVGFTSEFKNTKVTGFKDVILTDVSVTVGPKKTTTHFKIKFELASEGDLEVTLKSGKTFTGTTKYTGNVEGDTTYTFTDKKENGVDFYEINPETTKCIADDVKSVLNKELREAIDTDPECQANRKDFEKIIDRYYEKVVCKMAAVVFQTAIENLRIHGRAGI